MNNCFLCNAPANIKGQDFGRVKIVRCNNCDYYEITNTAIAKIKGEGFPEPWRLDILQKVKNINYEGNEPKITFDNGTINISR